MPGRGTRKEAVTKHSEINRSSEWEQACGRLLWEAGAFPSVWTQVWGWARLSQEATAVGSNTRTSAMFLGNGCLLSAVCHLQLHCRLCRALRIGVCFSGKSEASFLLWSKDICFSPDRLWMNFWGQQDHRWPGHSGISQVQKDSYFSFQWTWAYSPSSLLCCLVSDEFFLPCFTWLSIFRCFSLAASQIGVLHFAGLLSAPHSALPKWLKRGKPRCRG